MISMFTRTACPLRRTLESIATPCSVKAKGAERRPPWDSKLEVTICDFKFCHSDLVSWNMKSAGKRSRLRFTA